MKKLKLENVQVQSFVTNLEDEKQEGLKGGATQYICAPTGEIECWTQHPWCYYSGSPCTQIAFCTSPK